MAETVKKTPSVLIGGNVSGEPAFGAYAAEDGMNFTRDVYKRVPYSLLEKTGRIDPNTTKDVFDPNKRWLRELAITSADKLDFQKAWETDSYRRQRSEHEWRDTYGGKLAIRTFSRGIVGSIFFAAGQHVAGTALKNYAYDPHDASKNSRLTNPLEYAARLMDITIGKGIYKTTLAYTKDPAKAKNAVTFRHTNHWKGYGTEADGITPKRGRSYGHEGLGITFDFGLASLGDYLGREIAGLIDPNTEKKWMKDGHIEVPQMLKALLKSVWTGVTKAMGEDYFAMAAGYPYVVRGTRNLIDKFSPGFKNDSDHWANGGSFKIDDEGKIVGNYQLEGMLDLGARFTVYNMFTKIFRDGYDKAASSLKHFWDGDRSLHLPRFDTVPTPTNLIKKAAHGIAVSANYLARTVIKVAIIMIPSSAVFAFMRAAQSKDIGLAIHSKKGPVGVYNEKGEWTPIFTNGAAKSDGKRSEFPITENTKYYYRDKSPANFKAFAPDKTKGYEKRFDPFGQTTEATKWHDRFTNPVGRFCYESGHILTEMVKPVARFIGGKDVDIGKVSKHTQRFVDATFAYTPYFMAKTDLLNTMYDTPRMNMGIDRMLSGLAHLRFGEFKAGFGETVHSMTGRPFSDPAREAEAQKKMQTYTNQLWSNQDEILGKERDQEYQDRIDALLSLGKPIPLEDLYRPQYTSRVGRRGRLTESANEPYYAQNVTPIGKKTPEDYRRQPVEEPLKQQANASWGQAVRDFQSAKTSEGKTIN